MPEALPLHRSRRRSAFRITRALAALNACVDCTFPFRATHAALARDLQLGISRVEQMVLLPHEPQFCASLPMLLGVRAEVVVFHVRGEANQTSRHNQTDDEAAVAVQSPQNSTDIDATTAERGCFDGLGTRIKLVRMWPQPSANPGSGPQRTSETPLSGSW
jgi:hypothetical protein